jgi:hypothetical protein
MMRSTKLVLAATSLLALFAVLAPRTAVAQELPLPIARPCKHPCLNKIIFGDSAHLDKLELHARINPATSIDPVSEPFTIEISNANGTVFTATLNPGDFVASGGQRVIYRNPAARSAGGLARVQIQPRHDANEGFRVDVLAYGDLSAATLADMTTIIAVGNDGFFNTGTWTQRSYGWAFDFAP